MNDRSKITPDNVREFLADTFPGNLGIEPLEIDENYARGRIFVDRHHLHPGGFVHGGAWTALGDTVAAWATFRSIPPDHDFTTLALGLNVFGSGRAGDEIVATARTLHAGRSTVAIEVQMDRIREGETKLAANLLVTQFVIAPSSHES